MDGAWFLYFSEKDRRTRKLRKMSNLDVLDKAIAVRTWMHKGFESLYLGFYIEEIEPFGKDFAPFFSSMGVEVIAKSCLIMETFSEWAGLGFDEAKIKIDEIARKPGHDIEKIIKKITEHDEYNLIKPLLTKSYDGCEGNLLFKALKAALTETRYPVPVGIYKDFPIKENTYWDPLNSSNFTDFCYEISLALLRFIKYRHGVIIDKERIIRPIRELKEGERFLRIFFKCEVDESDYFK